MDKIDIGVAKRYGSLLDSREQLVAAVPATHIPMMQNQKQRPAGLMVTDARIVVGADELKKKGQILLFGLRDRRKRIAAVPTEDHLYSESFRLRFEADAAEILASVDRDAATWDQIDDPVLGLLIANERGYYDFAIDAGVLQQARLDFDGVIPEDAIALGRTLAAEPHKILSEAEDAIVAEFLSVKNESWLADGEAEITEVEFRRRLSVVSFGVMSTTFDVNFADDDMFGGHGLNATKWSDRGWKAEMWG